MTTCITFDCYDTLVAYTAGKAAEIRAMVLEKGADSAVADAVVNSCGENEHGMLKSSSLDIQAFEVLATVLQKSLKQALLQHKLPYAPSDGDRLVQTVKDSRPFDDVRAVLKQLKQHYKLVILSNSQPDIIEHNINAIGVDFDDVVLAAEVKAYKPDLRMFEALIDRCDCTKDEIVHVAQGFYHDIIPGHAAGLRRVWINRNGHSGDDNYGPYDELPNLQGLPELL